MVERYRRRDEDAGDARPREPRWGQGRGGPPGGGRPGGGRPGGGRPGGGRPGGGRPPGGWQGGGRPAGGRPWERRDEGGRPEQGEFRPDRPYGERARDQRDERRPGARPGGWSERPRSSGPPPFARPRPPVRDEFRAAPRPPTQPAADLLAEGEELVAGRRPVEEAFAARRDSRRLLVVPERRAALEALVLHATTLRIPIVEVEGGTLTSLTGFDGHQGVALALAARAAASLEDVLDRARERREPPLVLVLDSLEDPQNLGTLLRSAEACGVHGVVFPTRRSAPLSPAAIKASAGATEHLLLVPVDDLAGSLADLRAHGLRLVGADEGAPLRYAEADLRGPLALVVGSEGRGISGALRRRLDMTVRIPMRGTIGSLNAAVAGSVLLFAAAEQRGTAEAGEVPDRESKPSPPPATETEAAEVQPAAPAKKRAARSKRSAAPPAGTTHTEQALAAPAEDDVLPGETPGEPQQE